MAGMCGIDLRTSQQEAEASEQTKSEYFSSVGETRVLLSSPRKTKTSVLQKIAKQACVQQEACGLTTEMQLPDTDAKAAEPALAPEAVNAPLEVNHKVPCKDGVIEPEAETWLSQKQKHEADHGITQSTRKRCEEDAGAGLAKKTCFGSPSAPVQTTDRIPPPPLPLPAVGVTARPEAFPVSGCKKTTVEVELLTPGKQAQRLLLASNNTATANQNRPAASLRGLSVKPASSASSIGSRSASREVGSENVPRTSRLRRTKRS